MSGGLRRNGDNTGRRLIPFNKWQDEKAFLFVTYIARFLMPRLGESLILILGRTTRMKSTLVLLIRRHSRKQFSRLPKCVCINIKLLLKNRKHVYGSHYLQIHILRNVRIFFSKYFNKNFTNQWNIVFYTFDCKFLPIKIVTRNIIYEISLETEVQNYIVQVSKKMYFIINI